MPRNEARGPYFGLVSFRISQHKWIIRPDEWILLSNLLYDQARPGTSHNSETAARQGKAQVNWEKTNEQGQVVCCVLAAGR